MLKKILALIAIIVAVFVAVVYMQPATFRVTRSAVISAPAEIVFANVNNLKRWDAWSPWAKLDPNATNTFEGPESGVGASLSWSGNSEVGEGRMTITESRPNELIQIRLTFVRPFAGTSTTEFTFTPEESGTKVSWSMFGENNFVGRAVSLIMDCETMLGPQLEKGLHSLGQTSQRT